MSKLPNLYIDVTSGTYHPCAATYRFNSRCEIYVPSSRIQELATALIAEAVECWGERCDGFDPECCTCRWWLLLDRLRKLAEAKP